MATQAQSHDNDESSKQGRSAVPARNRTKSRLTLPIVELLCGDALALERRLRRLPGVVQVYVNPATEMAYIEYRAGEVTAETISVAVERFGYRIAQRRR